MAEQKTKKKRFAWVGQIRDNYRMTAEVYPALGWLMLGMFAGLLVIGLVVGFILGNPFTFGFIGASLGLLAAMFYFSRRAMSAAYRQVEDQPGGAAAVVQSMRGGKWSCTPAVSVTKNQDMVHRVVGRPGVVLVSEGPSSRVGHMLASEKKRTQRFIPDTPILELQVGNEPDQVPIAKLQKQLGKLPKTLTPAEANAVRHKLEALTKQPAGIPKGYMPKSAKAAKAQMRGRQR
ncbi:MAG: DUF4191 domain-containing protein [Actinobacteria bacterium]|nr:DUF4191 domain-containing protein [Actinomycetota bacterium]